MVFLFLLTCAIVTACNPECNSNWKGNGVCNLECMSKPCDFDLGDCLVDCAWSGCPKNSSDDICDEECNSNICGFDFGDCGYCSKDCNETLFMNDDCDEECNNKACLFDNHKCGDCASKCFDYMVSDSDCDLKCFNYECGWDNSSCSNKECVKYCKITSVHDGKCDKVCNVSVCSFDGGDCDCSPGCNYELLMNDQCDTVCNTTECNFDNYNCFCEKSCNKTMQFNSICDYECNSTSCYYDNGDCICPDECLNKKFRNSFCDIDCNKSACFYDGGDCNCSGKCSPDMIDDGHCNEECNVTDCWNDGQDCFCARGCSPKLIDNSVCDEICNNSACGYDNSKCFCAPGCSPDMIENSKCDPACNNSNCWWDGGSCNCAKGCFPDMINNHICNPICNISECWLDGADCLCSAGCTDLNLLNDQCDSQCNSLACSFDRFKCGDCSSGCFTSMKGDKKCDQSCNTFECEYDLGDCSTIYYYWPNTTTYKLESSSSWSSLNPNYFDFSKNDIFVKIFMFGGNYLFNNPQKSMLGDFKYTNFLVEPFYCNYQNITGCFTQNDRPVYTFNVKMSFSVTTSLTFKNMIFQSDHGLTMYEGIDYCRFTVKKGNGLYNDRGVKINEKYLDSSFCKENANSNFFSLNGNRLSFKVSFMQNVEFRNMRLGMKSIINVVAGEVLMENVNFTNIVVNPDSSVINSSYSSCQSSVMSSRFIYKGGIVSFINNGFEVITENPLAGFLSLCNFQEIIISNVQFSMNLFSGYSKLLKFSSFFSLELNEINIQFAVSTGNLIEIDQTQDKKMIDQGPKYLNSQHISLLNSNFSNLVANRLLLISSNICQNVLIENNSFSEIEVNTSLIEFYQPPSLKNCILNYQESDKNGLAYNIYAKQIVLNNIEFYSNLAYEYLINMQNVGKLNLSYLEFTRNRKSSLTIFESILSKLKNSGGYAEKNTLPVLNDCKSLIFSSSTYNSTFQNLKFESNECPLGKFLDISEKFTLKSSEMLDSTVSSNNSLFYFEFSSNQTLLDPSEANIKFQSLKFENNSLNSNKKAMIEFSEVLKDTIYIENILFYMCGTAIKAYKVRYLEIEGIQILSSTSESVSGVDASPGYEAEVMINNAKVENSGQFLSFATSDRSELLLKITGSLIKENKASNLVFLNDRLSLVDGSHVRTSEFEGNEGLLFNIMCSGKVIFSGNTFKSNKNTNTSVIYLDFGLNLFMDSNNFLSNTGKELIFALSPSLPSILMSSSNFFLFNKGSCFSISQVVFTDKDSNFSHNSNSFGSILQASNKVTLTFENSIFFNNTATDYGNLIVSFSSKLTLDNISANLNTAKFKGGFLFIDQNSSFVIKNSVINENSGSEGSCVFSHYSNKNNEITNTIFHHNNAGNAGCINLVESKLSLVNSSFYGNLGRRSSNFYLSSSYLTSENVTFNGFTSKTTSFHIDGKSKVRFNQCQFYNHHDDNNGIGIFEVLDSNLEVYDTKFIVGSSDCSVFCENSNCGFFNSSFNKFFKDRSATLLKVDQDSKLTLNKVNISEFEGTAVYIGKDSKLTLSSSSIRGIYQLDGNSKLSAGILCYECESLNILHSNFTNLECSDKGGAISTHNNDDEVKVTIKNSYFKSCSAIVGGSLYLSNSAIEVNNSKFIRNSAMPSQQNIDFAGQGGAIFAKSTKKNSIFFLNFSRFFDNSANVSGGAIQWYNNQPETSSSEFIQNFARYGPDIASFAHSLKLSIETQSPIKITPGVKYSSFFQLRSNDHYNQLVLTENSGIVFASIETPNYTLSGTVRFKVVNGIANISDILIKGKPNSFVMVFFSTSFQYAEWEKPANESVEFILRECLVGEYLEQNDSCISCPDNKYNLEAGAACKKCPTGAICYGGSSIVSDEGYWRKDNNSDIFYKCFISSACLRENRNDSDLSEKCEKGHKGNLCQTCEIGYSKDTENKCSKCDNDTNSIIFIILIILSGIAIIFILTASTINSAYKEQSITSVYFKILTNYCQIIALTISFDLDWPYLVRKFFSAQMLIFGASERLFSIDCLLRNKMEPYYAKLILINLTPLGFSLLSTLYWVIKSKISKTEDLKSKIIGSMTIQVFFFMASIIKINFSMFNCMTIQGSGLFLVDNLDLKCWEGLHFFYLLFVAVPGICFWCFFVPLLISFMLFKKHGQLDSKTELLKFGFLHKGFQSKYFYWEFVILIRKIAIICCAVFLRNYSVQLQALTTFAIILFAFMIHIKSEPYTANQLNSMETRSIIVSGVTIYSGLYFMTDKLNEVAKFALFIIIVLANLIFLLYWILYCFGYYFTSILLKMNCFKRYVIRKNPGWVNKMVTVEDFISTEQTIIAKDFSSDRKNSPINKTSTNRFRINQSSPGKSKIEVNQHEKPDNNMNFHDMSDIDSVEKGRIDQKSPGRSRFDSNLHQRVASNKILPLSLLSRQTIEKFKNRNFLFRKDD